MIGGSDMNKTLQFILQCLIALLLTFALILFQTLFFVDRIIFNSNTYSQYLNQATYFSKLTDEIDGKLTEMCTLYNIPAKVMTDALNDDQLKTFGQDATVQYIKYFRGETDSYTATYDMTKIRASLEAYLHSVAASSGTDYNTVYAGNVDAIILTAQETIDGLVMVVDPSLVTTTGIGKRIASVVSRVPTFEMIALAAAVVLVLAQWALNPRHRKRTIWWCGSSLLVSGILILIPGLYLTFTHAASGFGLQSESVQWITEHCIGGMITIWIIMGIVSILVAAGLMVYYAMDRQRRVNKSKSQSHHHHRHGSYQDVIWPVGQGTNQDIPPSVDDGEIKTPSLPVDRMD